MRLRFRSRAGAALAILLLSGCVPRTAPPPVPAAPPAPAPASAPAPAPAPLAWEDAAPAPGDWRWHDGGGGSTAAFGASGPLFVVRCEPDRRIALIRVGARAGTVLTIRTSYGARALPATPAPEGLSATVAASDPVLDSIVFSRGRFAVEAPDMPLLVLPAWPEPARVVEDCRG